VELLASFRFEQRDPDRFYRLISQDATALLSDHVVLEGACTVDVGAGAGYLTQALRDKGARCVMVDPERGELTWRGPPMPGALIADGRGLPFASGTFDLAVCSNVLEHVRAPFDVLDEMARVLRPGGHLWLSFTNWYGPWGGHETSPWHYLGGERAAQRYMVRAGRPPKNRFGESLFALHVGSVLRYFARAPGLAVVDARPRYLPDPARGILRVPVVRELCTWNLEVLARRQLPGGPRGPGELE
jgi:SAM-dependent methyltransferase